MRFSLSIDPGRPWSEIVALVRHLEAVGGDGVFVCDHFMPYDRMPYDRMPYDRMPYDRAGRPADGAMLEGWTTLAALAGHTRSLRLGTLVLGNTYRHPALVANMAAALDQATGGRFVLGLGAGWQANEHAAYGLRLGSFGERLERLDEACAAIRGLLDQPRTTMDGRHYRLTDAPCDPKPVQRRLPLLIGGAGRRTLAVAARWADEWHTWDPPGMLAERARLLDQLCADVGRDPGTIRHVSGGSVSPTDPAGPDLVAAYRAAGIDEFILRDDRGVPLGPASDGLSWFWSEVVPALR